LLWGTSPLTRRFHKAFSLEWLTYSFVPSLSRLVGISTVKPPEAFRDIRHFPFAEANTHHPVGESERGIGERRGVP
jgi:hypothetical protein